MNSGLVAAVVVAVLIGSGLTAVSQGLARPTGGSPGALSSTTGGGGNGSGGEPTTGPMTGTPTSPHPGTLDINEVTAAGGLTEDPALANDAVSGEPILNVYETLVSYNGAGTAGFVPTLATCVPGTAQCTADYGSNLTTGPYSAGTPTFWTFVIDPRAHFYDPKTETSWPVYPSDVMFSIARTLAFTDQPFSGRTAGWLLAQALLPGGNSSWDSGVHAPYNTTPSRILGSLRVNDSAYCPAVAMNGVLGNGCITFVANGSGQLWPSFLEFVADDLGASIVPCGWFTTQAAGVPGWSDGAAPHGDGPCLLPDHGTTTSSSAWTSYLASLGPTAWDGYEAMNDNYPATQPSVRYNLTGSGPYWASVSPGSGYVLTASPGYAQPSACGGAPSHFAQYTGYCDPAPGNYAGTVNVTWAANPSTCLVLTGLPSPYDLFEGPYHCADNYELNAHVLTKLLDMEFSYNENWSLASFDTDGYAGTPNIPADFFSYQATRSFLTAAYPYDTLESTVWTVGGEPTLFESGGPIPQGMGNYYPTNVSFPKGNPDTNPNDTGGAAWWWAEANNASSPYFDPELASCSSGSPCVFPILADAVAGTPLDIAVSAWIIEISALSGGALEPYAASPPLVPFEDQTSPGMFPLPVWDSGMLASYPDPTDVMTPMALPGGEFTSPDSVASQMALPTFDGPSCPNAVGNYSDLVYWSHQAELANGCQGAAYGVAAWALEAAGPWVDNASRVLYYDLGEEILNALSLYVWYGQANQIDYSAPWIAGASVNANPMVGGSGEQPWFQLRYVTGPNSTVTFSETGLPSGAKWSVAFNGTLVTAKGSSIAFSEPNGTYDYLISGPSGHPVSGVPASGTVTVSGAPVNESFSFVKGSTYVVKFVESGLPKGETWCVVLDDLKDCTALKNVRYLNLTPGSYPYVVPSMTGQTITATMGAASIPLAGTLTVQGNDPVVSLKFVYPYAVTFSESGLPPGTQWSVTLKGVTQSSTTQTIGFLLSNGTYSFKITKVSGYKATASPRTAKVKGAAVSITVTFRSVAGHSGIPPVTPTVPWIVPRVPAGGAPVARWEPPRQYSVG